MAEILTIHPQNPQTRLINQAVEIILKGGLIVYPTDSGYALGCQIGNKEAMERIRTIRQLDKNHHFTLMCSDLSELSTYARVDNASFRLLKKYTPGAFTFILNATSEVPRRLQNPKRKTIGLRVPLHPIALMLLKFLGEPLMSVSMILPGEKVVLDDIDEIQDAVGNWVEIIIDGGNCGIEPTTIIDLTGRELVVIREGKGKL